MALTRVLVVGINLSCSLLTHILIFNYLKKAKETITTSAVSILLYVTF